jgi:hypothetical protein
MSEKKWLTRRKTLEHRGSDGFPVALQVRTAFQRHLGHLEFCFQAELSDLAGEFHFFLIISDGWLAILTLPRKFESQHEKAIRGSQFRDPDRQRQVDDLV